MIECGPGLIDWATFFMFTAVRKRPCLRSCRAALGQVVSGEYLKKDKFPNPFVNKLWVPV